MNSLKTLLVSSAIVAAMTGGAFAQGAAVVGTTTGGTTATGLIIPATIGGVPVVSATILAVVAAGTLVALTGEDGSTTTTIIATP